MSEAINTNRILTAMLDRLFVAITNGPALNCRPHASRQRLDLATLSRLQDLAPERILSELLSERAKVQVRAAVAAPPQRVAKRTDAAGVGAQDEEPEEVQRQRKLFSEQQSLLSKVRILAEEARTYLQDTGAHVLYVGYPILSIPAGDNAGGRAGGRRISAPIAFIPVEVTVRSNAGAGIEIACREDEIDRVIPNEGLMAWIERQTGRESAEFFADSEGKDPLREIRSICGYVAKALDLALPAFFSGEEGSELEVRAIRRDDESEPAAILPSAVLGLFPTSKQGLLRDTKAMVGGASLKGPIGKFLSVSTRNEPSEGAPEVENRPRSVLPPTQRRLVTQADPCQARAVALAREADALVVHGPPGTGKSQTITNIIADHLARGERVLFVCDKRTALDVVANRLEHLGLGSLCAVVHDAQRDQRELYRSVRDQIETLADTQTPASSAVQLNDADAEIAGIHEELQRLQQSLMQTPSEGGDSLHALIGRWLEATLACSRCSFDMSVLTPELFGKSSVRELDRCNIDLRAIVRHAEHCSYWENPWGEFAGLELGAFLAMPMDALRSGFGKVVTQARVCDGASHPAIPPFADSTALAEQQQSRKQLLEMLEAVLAQVDIGVRRLWCGREADAVGRAARSLEEIGSHIEAVRNAAPDAELKMLFASQTPAPTQLAQSIAALAEYEAICDTWHAPLHFGRRGAARKVLAPLGLPLTREGARRAKAFLSSLRSALIVRGVISEFDGIERSGFPDMAATGSLAQAHARVIGLLRLVQETPALVPLRSLVIGVVQGEGGAADVGLVDGLRRSNERARALIDFEQACVETRLFETNRLARAFRDIRSGGRAEEVMAPLGDRLSTMESVLRIREGVTRLPESLQPAVRRILDQRVDQETALLVLRQRVLGSEAQRRIDSTPGAATIDPQRIQTLFDRWEELDRIKHTLVRNSVLTYWLGKQRSRLLVSTGSRLNGDGAELRRRLSSRGTHSLRLRQVLEFGRNVKDGDPLLDLRPVWMASPETVAQIFPREEVFDIVVFDEASQCRLEEALPILLRARRVVVAGDPKQLPPTRFFEDTSLSVSDPDDIETDQDLFETQQSEVEDLLSASLNLDLQQTYLDVHYRSRNADLIEFSNEQFYGSRLQAIPGHPANKTRYAPLTLYNVKGVYEKRTNEAEANQVVKIIRDLLRRADPPSIGVGCFNIAQRDLIVERLDEAAASDAWFGEALAVARLRRGHGSFEGLFVKNLENVQGDERDHIIISTTYGRDTNGKFYRRFGPLAMPGGGRRLNVLVTRARCEVHLVTSIPPEVYRALPPVQPGQAPGGGWLLFSYLQYAEKLAALYERANASGDDEAADEQVCGDEFAESSDSIDDGGDTQQDAEVARAEARVRGIRNPSLLAKMLGERLVRENVGSTVHWGNDGFCVDVALDHPIRADDVTIGVLTDFSRFGLAHDQVEWDAFSTAILRGQGWNLQRLWSPVLFRDLQGAIERIGKEAAVEAAKPAREPM